ncbi:hypothetical protein L207DRAFT_584747 [Hyaloscypha variabilis F]|uniref:Cora-domain-containing protein n=1 Tax=Hyaloscypha variabilis (strain UAMH 11265 / GT02V1 / F) TaxID=1149755 RepID=A0A2J6RH15_HYAVF|nr:hypothetical protein L207DRAFT_584747 [Hyaloscypha variabilis F]
MANSESTPSSPIANYPTSNGHQLPERSHTFDIVEDRIDSGFKSIKSFARRKTKSTSASLQEWALPSRPYLEYIRQLIAAGWSNLQDLDDYLLNETAQDGLVVSVLDITQNATKKRWPDIHNELDLKKFMEAPNRDGVSVRLYMAEYQGCPASGLIETLGGGLNLDPRFFQWSIHRKGHVFTPSQRHRLPFINLGFGVLDAATPNTTDAEKFKVLVYIQPDEDGNGWTGIFLFSTHTKTNISPRLLTAPPPFRSVLPRIEPLRPKSIREIYLESFDLVDLSQIAASPLYGVSFLLRLDCFLWNQIITAIREEDRRIHGISDTTIGHTEEIKKTLDIVKRYGSYGWPGQDFPVTKQCKVDLEEDFQHLVEQTDLLWDNRDKMAAIRQKNSEARWNSLTNAFTYLFAPVTIISGIYGMNVSQISGTDSNPNIWQFFVAVIIFNILILLSLAFSRWIRVQMKHKRTAGWKEIFGFAVGKVNAS